ncbi:hypothetical protein [Gordonia insulae]|uniref:Uncharacterized protein n=1 Tax=Gordonia insulae TaxID=2420509 RepID=A0A3G8JRY3_9ACTN|nr:hypothetical protein [Gordonia insulae]AZG46940.1 hypothetical protein D7316_03545 [Gordonia insulae]
MNISPRERNAPNTPARPQHHRRGWARVAPVVAAAAIAAGVIAPMAGAAGDAHAAPRATGARLTAYQTDPYNIRITIEGVFRMSRVDADTIIKYMVDQRVGGVRYTLRGDDVGTGDPVLFERLVTGTGTMPGGHLVAADDGLHYLKVMAVPREYLNEDDNAFDDDDEVYAQVHLNYAQGGDRYATSPVVGQRF